MLTIDKSFTKTYGSKFSQNVGDTISGFIGNEILNTRELKATGTDFIKLITMNSISCVWQTQTLQALLTVNLLTTS